MSFKRKVRSKHRKIVRVLKWFRKRSGTILYGGQDHATIDYLKEIMDNERRRMNWIVGYCAGIKEDKRDEVLHETRKLLNQLIDNSNDRDEPQESAQDLNQYFELLFYSCYAYQHIIPQF
jgi:hypothetical protein